MTAGTRWATRASMIGRLGTMGSSFAWMAINYPLRLRTYAAWNVPSGVGLPNVWGMSNTWPTGTGKHRQLT